MPHHPRNRNGSVTPLMVVFMVVFIIFSGIAANHGWIQYHKINAKTAADLTAQSTLQLYLADDNYITRQINAEIWGSIFYRINRLDKNGGSLAGFDSERIKFGSIEDITVGDPTFVEAYSSTDVVSAVYVTPPTSATEDQINLFFPNLLGGRETVAVSSQAKTATTPVDIMLCLDASRSMHYRLQGGGNVNLPPGPNSRWQVVMDTVALFLDSMQEINKNARVGLVTFGGGVDAPAGKVYSPLDDEEARFENALTAVISPEIDELNETLQSYVTDYPALGWGTRLAAGIDLCIPGFENENAQKHILVLGDGASPVAPTLNAAADAADNDIRVHSISFTGSYGVLEDVALAGEGMFFVALTEEELKEAFRTFLGNLKSQLVD